MCVAAYSVMALHLSLQWPDSRHAFARGPDLDLVTLGFRSGEVNMLNYRDLIFIVIVAMSAQFGLAASFHGLSNFSDTNNVFPSNAGAVSDDGQVVVGKAGSTLYRWTRQSGAVAIDALVDSSLPGETQSRFLGISGNGHVIVGQDINENGRREAFRWTAPTDAVGLGFVGGFPLSNAQAASHDGTVIAGHVSNSFTGSTATVPFRWTAETGIVELGFVEGATGSGHDTHDISTDGSIIVGTGRVPSDVTGFAVNVGFRWSEADGSMKQLLPVEGAFTNSLTVGVSADGSVAVGKSFFVEPNPNGFGTAFEQATIWRGLVPHSLGSVAGLGGSTADATNRNGSMVVGSARLVAGNQSLSGARAFIWDDANGMRLLHEVLEDDFGLDLFGWTLYEATDITPDGQTILGRGLNPDGVIEAYIVAVPEPAGGSLIGGFMVWFIACRRARRNA
jgi:uncharacterized membrane protein